MIIRPWVKNLGVVQVKIVRPEAVTQAFLQEEYQEFPRKERVKTSQIVWTILFKGDQRINQDMSQHGGKVSAQAQCSLHSIARLYSRWVISWLSSWKRYSSLSLSLTTATPRMEFNKLFSRAFHPPKSSNSITSLNSIWSVWCLRKQPEIRTIRLALMHQNTLSVSWISLNS